MKNPLLKIAALVAAGALALTGCGGGSTGGSSSSSDNDTVYKIGISQYVSHPSLDAAKEGFKQALADAGLKAPRPADMSLATNKIAEALGRPQPTVQESLQVLTQLYVEK